MSDADYAAEQREGRIRIVVELTPAQHAAAVVQAGDGGLAEHLAQLPIAFARAEQEHADESEAGRRIHYTTMAASALACRSMGRAYGWNELAVYPHVGDTLRSECSEEEAAFVQRLVNVVHAAAEPATISKHGEPTPAVRAAQERLAARWAEDGG